MDTASTYTVFLGHSQIAAGPLASVLSSLKKQLDRQPAQDFLVFDDESGQQLEFDLRGSLEEVLAREAAPVSRGPGRPKLGVLSREVSLLPRHWDWLEQQPSGISAALRRLVEEASKREPGKARAKRLRAALSRVMTALAGNFPNYEEATRALFAGDQPRLRKLVQRWPADVRSYVLRVSGAASDAEQAL